MLADKLYILTLISIKLKMDSSKFKAGKVHFTTSGLKSKYCLYAMLGKYFCNKVSDFHSICTLVAEFPVMLFANIT